MSVDRSHYGCCLYAQTAVIQHCYKCALPAGAFLFSRLSESCAKPGFAQMAKADDNKCMPLRTTEFAPNEHYHLCVRGNNKQVIFNSRADRARLLFLITHLQSEENFQNISRIVKSYLKNSIWDVDESMVSTIIANRYVALESFALMDNHLHLGIREEQEHGVTKYMQRVLTAYAKYRNLKYEMVGHVFQGPYRAVHIENNDQLLYVSTYIHRNPRELRGMAGKEHQYEWSSYQDYIGENRFGGLLDRSLVLEQFPSPSEYQEFVNSSIAKDSEYLFDPF